MTAAGLTTFVQGGQRCWATEVMNARGTLLCGTKNVPDVAREQSKVQRSLECVVTSSRAGVSVGRCTLPSWNCAVD